MHEIESEESVVHYDLPFILLQPLINSIIMKRYISTIFLFFLVFGILSGQMEKSYSIHFEEKDFFSRDTAGITHLFSLKSVGCIWGDTLSPKLPYFAINILVASSDEFVDYSYSTVETLFNTDVLIAPNPNPLPTNRFSMNIERTDVKYDKEVYPQTNVEYTGTHLMDGYKFLSFIVCPFRYVAKDKKLYFEEDIIIKLELKHIAGHRSSENGYVGGNMMETVKGMIINDEEFEALYPVKQTRDMENTNSAPFKYVIVTCDSLRPVFEKLAVWKTIKGIRANVITKEECYASYPNDHPQLAIKKTLADYYDNGMEYTLLGGDVDIIPARNCFLPHIDKTDDTPADLYYACLDKCFSWDANGNGIYGELDDNIDLDNEFIVTRASVSSIKEAETFVNRIVEYESSPNIEGWENNILMCGYKIDKDTIKNNTRISDAQWQGEYVYENAIQHLGWNGNLFELFDTYTDHPTGTNYRPNPQSFQTELAKGYSFVSEYSHGWVNRWGHLDSLTSYRHTDAENLVNSGYSIISTISCYSNAFDKVSTDFYDEIETYSTSLSESFLRNPNSGVLAYFGSSREGYLNYSYLFEKAFYSYIFYELSDKRLGRAAMAAKNTFTGYYNSLSWNNYRKLTMSLNTLGDPEMPVYIDTPQSFENVSLDLTNGILNVSTGVTGCTLCISSAADLGNSYYVVVNNTTGGSFMIMPNDCYLCITKPGYIPYLARLGSSVCIQNETFASDIHVFSTQTTVGRDITTSKPQGDVFIDRGKFTNISKDSFIIMNSFEVKQGAELELLTYP